MREIKFYHVIDDAIIKKDKVLCCGNLLSFELQKKYYFYINDEKKVIDECEILGKEETNTFELKDDSYEWDKEDVHLEFCTRIQGANYIFGSQGLVYEDAIVGVGIEWKSKKSRIKHCEKLGNITIQDRDIKLSTSMLISDFTSDISFELILYIAQEGTTKGTSSYANLKGLIFGRINLWNIKFEGNASIFPIQEIKDSSEPLWKIVTSYQDIETDEFNEESVIIYINSAHKQYQYIQEKHKNFNIHFLSEVISSAVAMLIIDFSRDERFNPENIKNAEEGSIAHVLRYFNYALEIDLFNGEKRIVESVKIYFDRSFK